MKTTEDPKPPRGKFSVKQQRFIEFYSGNGTDAARRAGYKGTDSTLATVAKENLRKPHIRAAIEKREAAASARRIATRQERQEFWSAVMRGDPGAAGELPEMRDRLKASELLAKSGADFVERIQHEGAVVLTVKLPEELRGGTDG